MSAAIIDAHAGVPGAGAAEAGTLVMVLGTSSCHMLNSAVERPVPGVAGIVEGGILPGYFGYETGQAAVGDAFDWFRRLVNEPNFDRLTCAAQELPPGADGVLCVDWLNGCRTPLMDGSLTGAFSGLTLGHTPGHLYRALMEASAFGLKWIVEMLRNSGVPVERFIATGGLPHHNPLLVQIYADALGEPIGVHPSKHGSALGSRNSRGIGRWIGSRRICQFVCSHRCNGAVQTRLRADGPCESFPRMPRPRRPMRASIEDIAAS